MRARSTFAVLRIVLTCVCSIVVAASPVQLSFAAAEGTFDPGEGELFYREHAGKVYTCALNREWLVGTLNTATGIFTPTIIKIQSQKRKMKKLRGAKLLRTKRVISSEKRYMNSGAALCAEGPERGTTTPPTPSPSPTPVAGVCFNSNGDTKAGCFGIPSPWVGNRARGQTYYVANCTGCHETRSNKTFQEVDTVFNTQPEMLGFRPPTMQDFVDVVAYINRGSL